MWAKAPREGRSHGVRSRRIAALGVSEPIACDCRPDGPLHPNESDRFVSQFHASAYRPIASAASPGDSASVSSVRSGFRGALELLVHHVETLLVDGVPTVAVARQTGLQLGREESEVSVSERRNSLAQVAAVEGAVEQPVGRGVCRGHPRADPIVGVPRKRVGAQPFEVESGPAEALPKPLGDRGFPYPRRPEEDEFHDSARGSTLKKSGADRFSRAGRLRSTRRTRRTPRPPARRGRARSGRCPASRTARAGLAGPCSGGTPDSRPV